MARENKKTLPRAGGTSSIVKEASGLGVELYRPPPPALCVPSSDLAGLQLVVDACGLTAVPLETLWNRDTESFDIGNVYLQESRSNILGLLANSTVGARQVEQFRLAWLRHFKFEAPNALCVGTPVDQLAIAGWISRELIQARRQMAKRNTTLMRDLYVVRSEHEGLQEAFQKLESFAYSSALVSRQLALCLEAQKAIVKIGKSSVGQVLQRLPASSAGICDVAIHIAQLPKAVQGRLEVSLRTLEDERTVGSWTLDGSQIRTGWLQLGLEQALGVDEKSGVVHVQWSGSGEIGFSLSSPHPEPRWCVAVGGKPASAPLALKLWRSFPGTRANPAAQATMNASTERQTLMLYADALRKVENLGSIPDGIAFVEHLNSLLVHPVAGKTTWARLSNAVPAGVTSVSADIETRNEKAGPVEYAIAVAPATEKVRKSHQLQFGDEFISDWINVNSTVQSQLHLNLQVASASDLDLYLGTRLPPGASNAYCWAHFSKIRMSR